MKPGRPVEWTPERKAIAQEKICILIATATVGLRTICDNNDDLPSYRTVMNWKNEDPEFLHRYTRAREEQAHFLAAQIVEIADEKLDGSGFANADEDDDGTNHAAALRVLLEQRKQKIDARKWAAAKLNPKVYGDRLNLDADVNIKLTDEQVEARLAYLAGKAGILGVAGGEGAPEEPPEVVLALPVDRPSET